jgi:hypothetical protein
MARWLQALLYNPGGLKTELYHIRLNWIAELALALIIIGILLKIQIFWDFLPLILSIFFLAGLSLVHCIAAKKYPGRTLTPLIIFYLILILGFKYIAGLVIIASLIDCWFDMRTRLVSGPQNTR